MQETPTRPELDPLLDRDDLRTMGFKMSRQYLNRLMADGKFPSPREITERKRQWRKSDIDAWIDSRPIATYAKEKPRKVKKPDTAEPEPAPRSTKLAKNRRAV
jgi:predicted DNA-binding transcriptional regulator AlpA